jgi:hypothetical protein
MFLGREERGQEREVRRVFSCTRIGACKVVAWREGLELGEFAAY